MILETRMRTRRAQNLFCRFLHHEQGVREPLPLVGPGVRDGEAGGAGDPLDLRGGVLAGALRVDRLAFGERELDLERVDAHALFLAADEVHLDARFFLVVEREMREAVEAEGAAELAVGASEDVEGDRKSPRL